jgi:hypothetical protein
MVAANGVKQIHVPVPRARAVSMLKKLKNNLRAAVRQVRDISGIAWRLRALEAELAEVRLAVAALAYDSKTHDEVRGDVHAIDNVLLHAAKAKIDGENLRALYESMAMRVIDVEQRIERLQGRIKSE